MRAPPISQSVNEAAEQALSKQTKIETMANAIFAKHLATIAEADAQDVAFLKAKRLGGPWADALKNAEAKVPGDMTICDDQITNNYYGVQPAQPAQQPPAATPAKSSVWPWVAGLVGTGVLGAGITGGAMALANKQPQPAVTNTSTTEGFNIKLVETPPTPKGK